LLLLLSPLAISVLCYIFLHSSRAHLDLHSFPTRRSSDLFASISLSSPVRIFPCSIPPIEANILITSCSAGISKLKIATGLLVYRSEEHTSELQSRFDLVCRLLLEKKKNKT